MAAIIRIMDDSTLVEYNEFTIIDDGEVEDPVAKPFAQSWEDRDVTGDWLAGSDNLLMINSAYATHRVRIRFELWDVDPGSNSQQSPEVDEITTSFYSSSGSIVIDEMLGDDDHDSFELGPLGQRWHVRAHRRALMPQGCFPESIREELESYIIQFWPFD
ncbi:hypothetical protein [Streptosporangium sp. KLBMP 9127]|nr:hypothetical protein [Streptosporangium sp. KLBMP 9127]